LRQAAKAPPSTSARKSLHQTDSQSQILLAQSYLWLTEL
jgi:hypothetical protein